jgi:hypothetical protein
VKNTMSDQLAAPDICLGERRPLSRPKRATMDVDLAALA